MPQHERVPKGWELNAGAERAPHSVALRCSDAKLPFEWTFEIVRKNVFKTSFFSASHPLPPRPSVARPEPQLDGVTVNVETADNQKTLRLEDTAVTVNWEGASPLVSVAVGGSDQELYQDLPHRAYASDGDGIAHYTRYNKGTLHVGLGEKAAPMDLSGRGFELSATDSFGYDAHHTDPLYKNIPLLINATPGGCVATFSASHARGRYSVGAEMDGMWGPFKVYRQDTGGLEQYLIVGRTLADIVSAYAGLAGNPLLVPRWAFGYLSGGMKYSMLDDPPASQALLAVARRLREEGIPCSAHQLSSGYTVSETPPKTRNVFTWNRHRFPDPEGFLAEYRKLGIRVIANVKPYVLKNHPEYEGLRKAGALFTDPATGESAVARLWSAGGGTSGEGGHIDFTSEAGYNWWYNGVKKLREEGIECIWNDNNEYVIGDDTWECALNLGEDKLAVPDALRARPQIGLWGRSLHTELHGKSSHDACLEVRPNERPFVLTRSATAGTMRYACSSWSGDNTTSWSSMRGSTALSLTAGMCLMPCYGHDIGGFEGPQPSPELLLRWVQLGCHSPRFAINCYKTGDDSLVGDVIEPWMYPEVTPLVRRAIKRRYAMIPYLYSLMLESHLRATPPQRWVGWGHEADPEVWKAPLTDGETQYWLGDGLLVAGVYAPGESKTAVYLPRAAGPEEDLGYVNTKAPYQRFAAGQWATVDTEWHGSGIPVLARVGAAIPVGRDVQVLSPGEGNNPAGLPADDYRAVEIFPPKGDAKGRWFKTTWYEDDGISVVAKNRISSYEIAYTATETHVEVRFARHEEPGFQALWQTLDVILPPGEERELKRADGAGDVTKGEADDQGRQHYWLA